MFDIHHVVIPSQKELDEFGTRDLAFRECHWDCRMGLEKAANEQIEWYGPGGICFGEQSTL